MICFRIEDVSNYCGISRNYKIKYEDLPVVSKRNVHNYLAEEIKKQVNGAKDRKLLSYSKSLGVCLLKYNEYVDNELHICYTEDIDYNNLIYYNKTNEKLKCKHYSLEDALTTNNLFNGKRQIKLYNFIVDVSDNSVLNKYLLKFTNVQLKKCASPEKDNEIIMMQACSDRVIKEYIDSIYILYALQLKYRFLQDLNVVEGIIDEILQLEDDRFCYCKEEREAIILLVYYLYYNTDKEELMNKRIFEYSDKKEHLSLYYDSMLQFHGIQDLSFEDAYNLSDYNNNVVSDIFWKYCNYFIDNCK